MHPPTEVDRRHLHPVWQQQVMALLSMLPSRVYRRTMSGLSLSMQNDGSFLLFFFYGPKVLILVRIESPRI
jgi:hypothetical protein